VGVFVLVMKIGSAIESMSSNQDRS
jgi:hypothetical protein